MKNVIKNIKDSKGFVSLETIIIAGAIIILGGVILYFFNGNANKMTNTSGTQMDTAQTTIQADGTAPTGVTISNANVK
ncbi:hypothetical protein [Rossellomorea marisflavi]|uniref:hypothetical protein n=1 Tax=Rossellomorea marisflavi TaxID=189381 RepID=UPI003FA1958C